MPDTETTRTCECGKDFTPSHWKQAYCCKQHAQHAYNARYRGHEPTWDIVTEFDCAQCDKHCIPGENVAPHASRFCGAKCKADWHHEQKRPDRGPSSRVSSRPVCRTFIDCICPECGGHFTWRARSRKDVAVYCSKRCKHKVVSRKRRHRKRKGDNIQLHRLAERDEFTCHICLKAVDMTLTVPDRMAPTIDHVLALCNGGDHSWENVSLAHMSCNSRKGAIESAGGGVGTKNFSAFGTGEGCATRCVQVPHARMEAA